MFHIKDLLLGSAPIWVAILTKLRKVYTFYLSRRNHDSQTRRFHHHYRCFRQTYCDAIYLFISFVQLWWLLCWAAAAVNHPTEQGWTTHACRRPTMVLELPALPSSKRCGCSMAYAIVGMAIHGKNTAPTCVK